MTASIADEKTTRFDGVDRIIISLGDDDGLGDIAWGRGNMMLAQQDLEAAYEYYLAAVDRYKKSGNEFGVGWSLFEAGFVLSALSKSQEAWPLLEEALRLFASHRDVSGVMMVVFQIAGVARALGDPVRTYRLVGVVDALRRSSGLDIVGVDLNSIEGLDLDRLDEVEGEFAAAMEEGRAMNLEEVVEYALAGPTDD